MRLSTKLLLAVGAALTAGSVSFAQTQGTGQSSGQSTDQSMQQQAQQQKDKMTDTAKSTTKMDTGKAAQVDVIQFKKGQANLSDQDKQNLRSFIDQAHAKGKIEKVHVVAWSDKPFPQGKGADLSAADRKLAKQREDTVKKFLKDDLKVSDTETYNMAEQSNWFARAFNTSDAELKSLFGQQGAPALKQQDFLMVKDKGGPMKAVVLVEEKQSESSMTGSESAK